MAPPLCLIFAIYFSLISFTKRYPMSLSPLYDSGRWQQIAQTPAALAPDVQL